MQEAVTFQAPYAPYNAGETAGVPAEVAARLIAAGRAVRAGEPLTVLLPPVQRGSRLQSVSCMACGALFMPEPGGAPHRCSSAPRAGSEVLEAGFRPQKHRWGRRRGR